MVRLVAHPGGHRLRRPGCGSCSPSVSGWSCCSVGSCGAPAAESHGMPLVGVVGRRVPGTRRPGPRHAGLRPDPRAARAAAAGPRREERQARRLAVGVLLHEVEGPAVHRGHEAVVAPGAVGRPRPVALGPAGRAADLVDELLLARRGRSSPAPADRPRAAAFLSRADRLATMSFS